MCFADRDDNDWWCISELNTQTTEKGSTLYFLIINKRTWKCLDVIGRVMDDGQPIQQWTLHGGDNQLWQLQRVEHNCFRIFSKHSGKCLDVPDGMKDDGVRVQQWSESTWFDGGINQQWILEDLGDGSYAVKAKHSGKCLDSLPDTFASLFEINT